MEEQRCVRKAAVGGWPSARRNQLSAKCRLSKNPSSSDRTRSADNSACSAAPGAASSNWDRNARLRNFSEWRCSGRRPDRVVRPANQRQASSSPNHTAEMARSPVFWPGPYATFSSMSLRMGFGRGRLLLQHSARIRHTPSRRQLRRYLPRSVTEVSPC